MAFRSNGILSTGLNDMPDEVFTPFHHIAQLLLGPLPADEEKLADSLDDLHMQKVKEQQPVRLKLAEVKAALALD